MANDFSDTELTLIADAVNRRIDVLDSDYQRLRWLAEEADAFTMYVPELETNRIVRAHYASIVRRIEQRLDVVKADAILDIGSLAVAR